MKGKLLEMGSWARCRKVRRPRDHLLFLFHFGYYFASFISIISQKYQSLNHP